MECSKLCKTDNVHFSHDIIQVKRPAHVCIFKWKGMLAFILLILNYIRKQITELIF